MHANNHPNITANQNAEGDDLGQVESEAMQNNLKYVLTYF